MLKTFFTEYGDIGSIKIRLNPEDKSYCIGKGYMKVKDFSTFEEIIRLRHFDFYGSEVECLEYKTGFELIPKAPVADSRKLYLIGLNQTVTAQEILKHCLFRGNPPKAEVMQVRTSIVSSCAVLEFQSPRE
jgi:hypothetical protein